MNLISQPLPSTDPLGTDVELNQNGDLIFLVTGDASIVTDADNVAQSVRTNLTTLPDLYYWGDDVGTYLAQYVDMPITNVAETEITSIIREKLNLDSRIIEIQGVVIDDQTLSNGIIVTIQALVESVGVVQIPVIAGGVSG